jgi:hypothetical protein
VNNIGKKEGPRRVGSQGATCDVSYAIMPPSRDYDATSDEPSQNKPDANACNRGKQSLISCKSA